MSEVTIEVERREAEGKNANRRLRARGIVPAVVYGAGIDPVPIQVDHRMVEDLLRGEAGEHSIFLLKLDDAKQSRHARIRELQRDPINGQMIHIDFQRTLMDQKLKIEVPIEIEGVPSGVKNEGGLLDFVTREVEVECLPGDIPAHLTLDVSALHIGQHLEASDLELPAGVELITDPDRVLVSVAQPRLIEEEVEEEDEGLIEKESDEPEVIGRGKDDEDEEEKD